VAVIVPSVNAVMESDLARFVPPGVDWRVARWVTGKAHQSIPDILPAIADLAADLAAGHPDIIGFGCTAASVVGGPEGSRQIAEAIWQRTGISAVTTGTALTEAARILRLRRILFCSPFDEDYDRPEVDGLKSFGVPIAGSASLGLDSPAECTALTPAQIAGWVAGLDHSGVDGVILSCANIRAFESVAALESLLGKPVISSNQALVWAIAGRLGKPWRPTRGGSLFG
jgi:maleate cis-trans isomerase